MTKVSKSGYKRNSKDKKEKSLVIPSNNITMNGVDFPVFGTDNYGNSQMMYPGMDYTFPGEYVYEVPMARYGGDPSIPDLSKGWLSKYQTGGIQPLVLPDDDYGRMKRKAYADSLSLYNQGEDYYKQYLQFIRDNSIPKSATYSWANPWGNSRTYAPLAYAPLGSRAAIQPIMRHQYNHYDNNDNHNNIAGQRISFMIDRYKKPVQPIKLEPKISKLPLKGIEDLPASDYQIDPVRLLKPIKYLDPNAGYLTTDFGDTNTNVGERVQGRFNLEDNTWSQSIVDKDGNVVKIIHSDGTTTYPNREEVITPEVITPEAKVPQREMQYLPAFKKGGWLDKYQTAGQVGGPKIIKSGNGFEYGYSGDNVMMRPIGQKDWTTVPADKVAAVKKLMPGLDFDVNTLTPDFQAWKKQGYEELEQKNQEDIKAKRAETIQKNKFKANPGTKKVVLPTVEEQLSAPVPITNRYEGMVAPEEQLPAPVSITNRYPGMVTPEEVLPSPVPITNRYPGMASTEEQLPSPVSITNRYPGMVTPKPSALKEQPYLGPDPITAPSGFTFEDPAKRKLVKGNTKDRVITYNQDSKDFLYAKGDGTYDLSNPAFNNFGEPVYDDSVDYLSGIKRMFDKEFTKEDPEAIFKDSDKIETLPEDNTEYGYNELYTVPDKLSNNSKDSLQAFTNTFDNALGARYYIGHKEKELGKGAKMRFEKSAAVAHFLRDADVLPNQQYAPEEWNVAGKGTKMRSTSKGKALSGTGLDNPEKYRMMYKPNPDGSYNVKYEKLKDIKPENSVGWEYDLPVSGQHRYSDIDWDAEGDKTGYAIFGNSTRWVPLKSDAKKIKGWPDDQTRIPYKDKDGFSRFSGGSIVYIFKDPKTGKKIGIDVAGSINTLKKAGQDIMKKYNISGDDIDVVYHDMGSYSAKPAAQDDIIDYRQWLDYNSQNRGFSGAPLIIPSNRDGGTIHQDNFKIGGWLSKYQPGGPKEDLSKFMKQPVDPNDLRYVGNQQAVQDNTRVVVPNVQTAAKKAPAATAEIQRVNKEMKARGVSSPAEVYAQEKGEAQQAAAIEAGTNDKLYADNQSGFDKAMYQAYNIASNPLDALGHYNKYGYVQQGNQGNYGLRDDASPMGAAVNAANPFAWLNAGIRLQDDLGKSETYTTLPGAANAAMDALEMLPMFTELRPLAGARMLADDAARAGKYFAPKSFNKIIWPEKPNRNLLSELEPYLGQTTKPLSQDEQIFRSFLSAEEKAKLAAADITKYNPDGSIKGFVPTKNVEFTNTAKTIANKVDLPKGVSKEDLMSIIDKNLNWVKSDEYIARRIATTGETKDQVVKLTEKWIDDLTNNTSYNSEAALEDLGTYSYLKNFPLKGKSYVNVSDDVFQNQPDAFLDVWEHEFLHGLSPTLKQPKLYNNYPNLNVTPKRSFVQKLKDQVSGEQKDLNYFNLPSEQQVRAIRLNSKIRKDLGITDSQLTKEHLDKWFDEYYNPNLESLGQSGFSDVTDLLTRAGNLYENTTRTSARPMFLDWLNKAWGVVPAAAATGAAGAAMAGSDTPQYKQGGWLQKYQTTGEVNSELSKFMKASADPNDLRYVNIAPEVQESTRVNIPNIKNAPKAAKAVKEEAARVKQKMQQERLSTPQEVYALEAQEAREAEALQSQQATLSPATERGISDYANYAWDIASNPMTAARYKMMGQDIPWNFKMSGERNILDMPLDMVNPAFYTNLAGNLVSASVDPDTYIDAGKTLWAGAKGLAGDRVSAEEMQAVGNTAGLLLDAGMLIPAGRLASKFASPYLNKAVTNTPLRYTYKINPTAKGSVFTPLEANMNYRYVNQAGYDDALKTFLVKANSIGDNSVFRRPTEFPSFSKGKPAKAFKNTDSTPHYLMQSDVPMYARGEINPITGRKIVGRHGAARPIDPNTGEVMSALNLEDINNIYKADPHWLKGYEKVYRSPKNADVSKITLGQNIAKDGAFNEGVYELPDYPGYLLKYERPKTVSHQIPEFMEMDLAQMQKNIKTPNIGKVIKQEKVLSDKKTKYLPNKKSSVNTQEDLADTLRDSQNSLREVSEYADLESDVLNAYIMRRIQGQPVLQLPLDELSKIPASAWKNYFADVKELAKNDLAIDNQGINVYYNPEDKAFKFIDLSPGVTPRMNDYWENIVIRGMSKNLPEDVMNRKITEGMMSQYDRALDYHASKIDKTLPQNWTADQRSKYIHDILLEANLKRGVLERSLKRSSYKYGGSSKYQVGAQVGPRIENLPPTPNSPTPNFPVDKAMVKDKLFIMNQLAEIERNAQTIGFDPLQAAELMDIAEEMITRAKTKYPDDKQLLAVLDKRMNFLGENLMQTPIKLPRILKTAQDFHDIVNYDDSKEQQVQNEYYKKLNAVLTKENAKFKMNPGTINPALVKFRQEGGSSDYNNIPQSWKDTYDWTPNVEAEYQAFKNDPMGPSNLAGTDDMNDYNTRGMWDSLDRPADWKQGLDLYKQQWGEEWTPEEDGYYHAWSQHPGTGEWLKPKHHNTAWMNYGSYIYDPNNMAVVNPEGFFGNETLQSYPKEAKYPDGGGVFNNNINKKHNLKTSAEGYYAYINGVTLSKGGSPKGWLDKYK